LHWRCGSQAESYFRSVLLCATGLATLCSACIGSDQYSSFLMIIKPAGTSLLI
jgi:hypothetical protein